MKRITTILLSLLLGVATEAQPVEETEVGAAAPLRASSQIQQLDRSPTIPVFFHVVQDASGFPSVSEALLQRQVDTLNAMFATGTTSHRVLFRFAGVGYTRNEAWFGHVDVGVPYDNLAAKQMKDSLAIDPRHVLNAYVTKTPDENNWATFPIGEMGSNVQTGLAENHMQGGVVIDYRTMTGGGGLVCDPGSDSNSPCYSAPKDHGKTLVHEVGHYLGLLHTFQCGCGNYNCVVKNGSFRDSSLVYFGDGVRDTAPHDIPSDGEQIQGYLDTASFCALPTDGSYGQVVSTSVARANVNANIMNYLKDPVRRLFTAGQQERIGDFLRTSRNTMATNSTGDGIYPRPRFALNSGTAMTLRSGMTLHIGDTTYVTVKAGASLTLQPDVRVSMGQDAQVASFGTVTAVGTQANPIRFSRATSSQPWKEVTLLGDGNLFEHVTFDGGGRTVQVQSRGNTLRNVRIRRGSRGVSTHTDYLGRPYSEVTLDNVRIDSVETVGVVGYYAQVNAQRVTINGSGEAGAWLYGAQTPAFQYNVVERSGRIDGSRSGIEVFGGIFSTEDPNYGSAYNRIADNAFHEVYLGGSVYGTLGWDADNASRNTIRDASHGAGVSEKLIYNGTGTTFYANGNYWGTSPAQAPSGYFAGSVSNSDALPTDETSGSGASASTLPSFSVSMLDVATLGEAVPSPVSSAERRRRLQTRLDAVLEAGSASDETAPAISMAYGLAMKDESAHGRVLDQARRWADRLATNPSAGAERSAAEAAATLLLADAVGAGRFEEARSLVSTYRPHLRTSPAIRAFALQSVGLLHREGRVAEARVEITTLRQMLRSGNDEAGVSALKTLEQVITETPDVSTPMLPQGERVSMSGEALSDAVVSLAPNPASSVVRVQVAAATEIRARGALYDLLGRRVRTLFDGSEEARAHETLIDASMLAPGMYVVRVQVGAQWITERLVVSR